VSGEGIHTTLIEGFRSIEDKNGLGWAVLDTKSETLLCVSVAVAINRRAGKRIAHVEYPPRIDLVILRERQVSRPGRSLPNHPQFVEMAYEAKAAALFTFAPGMRTDPKYLGGGLNDELDGMVRGRQAGIFFIVEAHEPERHKAYYNGHVIELRNALALLQQQVTRGELAAHETIDCGVVDGTKVAIHMCVFDPHAQAARNNDSRERS
jgi:hypothetical protein